MIDNSYLLGLYGGSVAGLTNYSSSATAKRAQPTAPWSTTNKAPEQSAVLRSALGGRKIINEASTEIDLKGASSDYRKLFALYQGLETLTTLNNRAALTSITASERSLIEKRFASGMAEVNSYMSALKMDGLRLVQGTSSATSKTTAAVARDSAKSLTGVVHEGAPTDIAQAFQGDVVFDIKVKRLNVETSVSIDLSEMGSTPRTLDKVLGFINGKLEDAGFETRLGREKVQSEPRTLQVGGKTVTLPDGADKWALALRGVTTETISFSAPQTSDAVYVVQGVGTAGAQQLLKFQADGGAADAPDGPRVGETNWVEGRTMQTSLPEGVSAVRASATAADGSIWIVADLESGPDSQPIKGQSDVALMRLDSAGRVISTRTLGAADQASGYAIAIGADGRIAVAGSVTGALEPGKSGDVANVADSFVTVFDDAGIELWTQRRGARAADEATSVAFGSNGQVIVAGRAKSAMLGATQSGGWDAYVQTFSQNQVHALAPVTGTPSGVAQFGTSGDDGVSAMTVSGNSVYTAGVENGRAVVRLFTLDASGKPTLTATRDLGAMSGSIADIAVSNGQVVLTGTTRNAALDVATVNQAHAGGSDVFVAALSTSLTADASERLTYYGGAQDDSAADAKIVDGKVWITGTADRAALAKDTDPSTAFLARLDIMTGVEEQRNSWTGVGNIAQPSTLTVASGGSSVLDRLGLPQGEIQQKDSKLLTAATSLRAGDKFYITPAGTSRAIAVTIEARDTLQTLARKIEQASRMQLRVTVASEGGYVTGVDEDGRVTAGGLQRLSIMARSGKAGAVFSSGESGKDALAGLGLSAGFVGPTSGDKATTTFGLNLSSNLRIDTQDAVKSTGEALLAAMKAIREAYRSLAPETATSKTSGTVPAYLTNQIANYQAALTRLTG